jgi:serine/threonine protein kinase
MIQRSTDHLKLIDFGFTSNVNSCRTLMVGTPDYMAPELVALETYGHGIIPPAGRRLKAEHNYDAKAVDVWSMGALLYIITVGCFPFEDSRKPNDMTWTLAKVRRGEFNRPPLRCSQELCDLFVCMFKVNPSKRITIEQLRGHPWMTCAAEIKTIDEQPASAPLPTAAQKPAPPPYTSAALAATVQAMAQSQPKQQEKMGRVAPALQPVPPPAVEDVKKSPRHGLGFLNFGMRKMAVSSPTSSPSSSPRVSASDAATGSSTARGQEGQASKRTRPAWLQPKS